MPASRLSKSIQNAKVALIFYFLNLVLQFFSRKIFLDYLGSEVLGLNTTAQNLLGFLNLAELGIGSAVAYNLYKPIYEGDKQAINDIVSIQGWLYRRVACVVIAGSCILMCFFPWIFAKAHVPLWYTYATFIALLIGALLSYFVNYKLIVLSADQKEYKITYCTQGVKITKVLLQMVAIMTLPNGYVYWIALEVIMAVVSSVILNRTLKKEYPWLCSVVAKGKILQKEYPGILQKTKQVFFHQIGGFVLFQTSPLVIYAYASLTLVTIYGNYMLIVSAVSSLIKALVNGINAGIGNLVAEGNKAKIKSIYWELTTFRMWFASVACFGIYGLGHPFITLWVGEEYLMPQSAFIMLIAITFIQISRTNDVFLYAYGLFQDIWSPIAEASLNLGLSILLGYYYGLTGILAGVLISLLVIVEMWKPFFLFHKGFKESLWNYIPKFLKKLILILSCWAVAVYFSTQYITLSIDNYLQWFIYATLLILLYTVISLGILYSLDASYKKMVQRLGYYLINKFRIKS